MDQELKSLILGSIEAQRLVMLCGAGLSMGAPTALPSAAVLCRRCAAKYEHLTGVPLDPSLHSNLGTFARLLLSRGQLRPLLIERLVEWEDFRDRPNPGHQAAADLLLCKGLRAVITTNYDTHIEDAARRLGERDFRAAVDGDELVRIQVRHEPLLKLHGCCVIDRANTVWLQEQLLEADLRQRIDRSITWSEANLRHRDFLIVGFWSDWSYLNAVLDSLLENVDSSDRGLVVVVDPNTEDELEEKAPGLWAWAHGGGTFRHVRAYAEEFLDALRAELGFSYVRRAWSECADEYRGLTGGEPTGSALDVPFEARTLYQVRRDMTGAGANEPVRTLDVNGAKIVAAVQRRLVDLGAAAKGPALWLAGRSYRVVGGPRKLMSQVQASYATEVEAEAAVDDMICVAAIADPTPASVVRPSREPNVIRPQAARRWLTLEAVEDLLRGAA
jgi:hypothetical protein